MNFDLSLGTERENLHVVDD